MVETPKERRKRHAQARQERLAVAPREGKWRVAFGVYLLIGALVYGVARFGFDLPVHIALIVCFFMGLGIEIFQRGRRDRKPKA